MRARTTASGAATLLAVTLAAAPFAQAGAAAAGSATTSGPTSYTAGTTVSGRATVKKRYSPSVGPVFNNPLGRGPARYRTLNKVQGAIDHSYSGSTIRAMSWNVMSRSVVDKLLAAQQRGARVLLIMDNSNLTQIPNPSFRRLRSGLAHYDKAHNLPIAKRSYAKVCKGSCRGSGGQAHAKYFLFSHTGAARYVFMEGSMNLTAASAVNQWNDVYTFVGNKPLYTFAKDIFTQAWQDKPVANPFREIKVGDTTMMFAPQSGKYWSGDPRLKLLDRVKCWGAKKAGVGGRTIIRVAPDVLRNKTGLAAAQQLRNLWERGCSVRIGYTVLGQDIHRLLTAKGGRRGPVPLRHLAQDFNGDGQFDNYFHLKVISINGVVGTNSSAHVVVNGSSNFSGFAARSDENIAIIWRKNATLAYQNYIDYWFTNFPKSKPLTTTAARTAFHVNPYAHVDMD